MIASKTTRPEPSLAWFASCFSERREKGILLILFKALCVCLNCTGISFRARVSFFSKREDLECQNKYPLVSREVVQWLNSSQMKHIGEAWVIQYNMCEPTSLGILWAVQNFWLQDFFLFPLCSHTSSSPPLKIFKQTFVLSHWQFHRPCQPVDAGLDWKGKKKGAY